MQAPNLTSALLSWYEASGRRLPWRDLPDPYFVLLSEVMLQQTTVTAVIPFFDKWIRKYPSVEDLAEADQEELLRDWEGLGYYSRVRNLHSAARQVVRQYDGVIPNDPGRLKKLPGIGDYTAAAVASIAFGARVPALDANNLRIWSRLLASSERQRIAYVFARIIPADRPGDFNQALMDLGSLVCTPRDPVCHACPLSSWCRAFNSGRVREYPQRQTRPVTTRIEAAIGIIIKGGKVLVQKRPETGLLAGMWEFPGGKIINNVNGYMRKWASEKKPQSKNPQPNPATLHSITQSPQETPEEAVVREVREETGLGIQVYWKLGVFHHAYTRFRVRLHVFLCRKTAGTLQHSEAKWAALEELGRLPMPSANRRIVRALEKHLDAKTR